MLEPWAYAALTLVAAIAGFVDSMAGGGGLIVIPALLFAGVSPLYALGTNKLQSVFGTAIALRNYWRSGLVEWRPNRLTVLLAFAGAVAGALIVQSINTRLLQLIVPLLLVASALYVLLSPRMTDEDAHHRVTSNGYAPIGAAVGFYDGFFGPGAGSFFVFAFVRLLGFDFLNASASAKLMNTATNIAALLLFAAKGHVWWHIALVMALANIAGSLIGTRLALKHGAGFVRIGFIAVVSALILKTGWDAFVR